MQRSSGAPILDGLNRAFGIVSEGFNALGTAWILALMILINADATGRSFLQRPITGVPEIVSLSIVGIVFLQLSSALRHGGITRSDMLMSALTRRWPRVATALEAVFNVAGALTLVFLLQASWPRFRTALDRMETVGVVGRFVLPTWPIKLILVIGTIAMLIQFLLFAAYALGRTFGTQGPSAPRTAITDGDTSGPSPIGADHASSAATSRRRDTHTDPPEEHG
ncbi:MAG: TRAP transporter small permease [Trueperaceae bacterium]